MVNVGMIYFHDGFSVGFFPTWGETCSGIENKNEHPSTSKKTRNQRYGKKNIHNDAQIEHSILMKHLPDNPGTLPLSSS